MTVSLDLSGLPEGVSRTLSEVISKSLETLGSNLQSVVLYGSAAENRLRPTSDLNLIFVLSNFNRAQVDPLREPLRSAYVTHRLSVMFLLESEINAAIEAFPVKFSDILNRRRVLHGSDPFTGRKIPRSLSIIRLKQVLMNLKLRMRNLYMLRSLREEQLAMVIADMAGPLRSAAGTLLELEGSPRLSPREAFQRLAKELVPDHADTLQARLTEARENRLLPPGEAADTVFHILRVVDLLLERAAKLSS
ncbi:hypothetical protein L0222_10930 [bacterium]|nr:hypothetical protein [bacterium]MCI0605949.1 hypothetical protein [bacterium]